MHARLYAITRGNWRTGEPYMDSRSIQQSEGDDAFATMGTRSIDMVSIVQTLVIFFASSLMLSFA